MLFNKECRIQSSRIHLKVNKIPMLTAFLLWIHNQMKVLIAKHALYNPL